MAERTKNFDLPKTLKAMIRHLPFIHRQSDGARALGHIKKIVSTDRFNSFDRWHDTSQTFMRAYEKAGAKAELYPVPTGGLLGTGRWIIQEAADVFGASAEIVAPFKKKICDWRENPWHVIQWSESTPPEGLSGALVIFDTQEELEKIPANGLRGKIVLTRLNPWDVRRKIADRGGLGVISDMPVKGCPDAVPWLKFGWGALPMEDSNARLSGISLSENQGAALRGLVQKHSTLTVRIKVDVRRYTGTHDVVSGIVIGRDDPQDEVWSVAHSAEPGALDNASGAAVQIEAAQILESLIRAGKLQRPRRSIRFLHAYECYGFFYYLEHQKRFQTPVAGMCVDTLGARPDLCDGKFTLHASVDSSAQYAGDVGEAIIRAALKVDSAGYEFLSKKFVPTEDTLLGDPKYGFPCPWITNHPFRGYHSSADVPAFAHPRGLATCATALAGYLYYLANAGTNEALELADWQTKKVRAQLDSLQQKVDAPQRELIKAQHAANLERLRRLVWSGEHREIETRFRECEHAILNGTRPAKSTHGPDARATIVPRRCAPIAPAPENTLPDIQQRVEESKLPKWAAYWADGKRTLGEIQVLLSAELKRDVTLDQVVLFFEALRDLKFVELSAADDLITKQKLIEDLKALGLKRGMDLMVHSSLSKIGNVAGGAETIVDALLETIGKNGTLLAPSFNHFEARIFNPLTTPTTNGAIPDAIWRRPDAIRSTHPSHSVAAIGPRAEEYCRDHLSNGIWAQNSPIGRLIHGGGYILLLGVDHNSTTAYHVAEVSLNAPCLDQFGSIDHIVNAKGEVEEVPGLAWRAGGCPVHPRKMNESLTQRGAQRLGRVGNADSVLVKAIDVWNERRAHLKDVCATCKVVPERRT